MQGLQKNRGASFAILAAVYLLAAAVGIVTYRALPLDWRLSLLIADMAATVFTFLFSLLFRNASVYDPYWSVQPPVILFAFSAGREVTLFGILLLAAVSLWAIRLTANWAYTFGNLTHEDWRYAMLREKTGRWYPVINFVGIHAVPTLVVWGCTLPAVFAIREGLSLSVLSAVFLAFSLGAALLQGTADVQMHKYRKHRDGAFCRRGLWKYSRHPNYLGEILMWWGVGLSVVAACPAAWGYLSGALANTALFFFVSIPLADGRQSRKEGFAEYKKQTRMLLPIKK